MKKTIQWAAAMVLLLVSTLTMAVVPINAGQVTLNRIPINTSPGEQYDPHVDQDVATYSELINFERVVHYYQFGSGIDRTIPRDLPGGLLLAQDFLPGVQGGRVVFNRYSPRSGDTTTMLFDVASSTLTEINPQPGSTRFGIDIGGNTVAYADMSVVNPSLQIGEIYAWDVSTQIAQRLTNDMMYDDGPHVSPSGDVIVWESCLAPYTDCDIKMARRNGANWTVDTAPNNPRLSQMEPSTDGTYVVWEANAGDANGWDIYYMPVGSTVPVRIELPGDQLHPRISGGVISFASLSLDPITMWWQWWHSDLFLYEIASKRVYQLTNTPTVDATLNSITRLPTGELRIVWQANDDMSTLPSPNNIYGATFSINQPPVANAGADQNLYLGQSATLTGVASSDANGDPLTYAWTLDAAPAGSTATLVGANTMTPSLTPDVIGAYHISLVVNDGVANSAASPVVVNVSLNLPPVAAASGIPLTGNAPLTVMFNAGTSYDPEGSALTYSWNFGDGTALSALVNPAHSYAAAGNYTAVVTVTDNFAKTDQASVAITVTAPNLPPVVLPTATPNHGASLLDVQFTANASDVNPADVLSYSWNFGDGSALATVANPQHTYSAGTYTATVTVSDGVNAPVSASLTISVSSALTIHVTEAKVERGEKGKVEGRVSMKADFSFAGVDIAWMPTPTDIIRVTFDGVTLIEVPFSSFKAEGSPTAGKYEYETKTLEAELDFKRGAIKVSRHKMLTGGIDNSNGIDVEISFGAATGTDHVAMRGEKDRRDSDLSHKE